MARLPAFDVNGAQKAPTVRKIGDVGQTLDRAFDVLITVIQESLIDVFASRKPVDADVLARIERGRSYTLKMAHNLIKWSGNTDLAKKVAWFEDAHWSYMFEKKEGRFIVHNWMGRHYLFDIGKDGTLIPRYSTARDDLATEIKIRRTEADIKGENGC